MTIKKNFTTGNLIDACHRVEERGLTRAVGTDKPGDHPFFKSEVNIMYGNETAEYFSNFASFKEIHMYLPLFGHAAFHGGRCCSGRSGFIFITMQFLTDLLAGEQALRAHRHHDHKRQAK